MKYKKSSLFKMRAAALAVASCLAVTPWVAEAASLGKITVLSALGQPLRAEIELAASREELLGMTAKLASRDTAQQAGVELLPVVSDLRFAIDKRPSGVTVVKVSSAKPVNEPFLDFFIELNWPSGRLVREYVFLLDPPDAAAKATVRPINAVESRPVASESKPSVKPVVAEKPAVVAEKPASVVVVEKSAKPVVAEKTEPVEAEKSEAKPVADKPAAGRREVKRGETLQKIAAKAKPEGVTLDQMLVSLYTSNPDAFIGGNLNRLKTGVILNMPDRDSAASVTPEEARKVLKTQVADWNSYRQKLATAVAKTPVAKEEGATQAAGGKITPKLEEKAAPAEATKDKVKVSRGEAAGKAGKSGAEEALVAKEKALKEAGERVALLEKSVSDLQKLVEMKNQSLADAQKQAAATKLAAEQRKQEEAKAAAVKLPEPAKAPAAAPAPVKAPEVVAKVEPAKPAEAVKPVEPPKVAEPPKLAEAATAVPVEPPKPVEPVKSAEQQVPQPKPAVKKPLPPPPPAPEEDSLLGDPVLVAGGGGILALLAGLLFYRRRKSQAGISGNASTMPMDLTAGPNSVFRNTGGQSVDTGNTTPPSTDFSQTGPGTIDTDEVDPVAEADVYMAYGRDAQAEEILLEALQKDPHRTAIHVKLLEIYAGRKSTRQFETLASELYSQTGGVGAEWEKVAALGLRLDPANPLYGHGQSPTDTAVFDADATMIAAPSSMNATLTMPGALSQLAEAASADAAMPDLDLSPTKVPATAELATLDFDLGGNEPVVAAPQIEAIPASDNQEPVPSAALDFDFGFDQAPAATPLAAEAPVQPDEGNVLDFDLGFGTDVVETPVAPAANLPQLDVSFGLPAVDTTETDFAASGMAATVIMPEEQAAESVSASSVAAPSLDFDMDLGEAPAAMPESVVDLSSINLDLAVPQSSPGAIEDALVTAPVEPAGAGDARWDEVNTKLDLAKAYEEMGDLEGARELLQEVLSEGPPDLVEQAKVIMGRVGE